MFRKIALTLLLTITIFSSSVMASINASDYTSLARPMLSTGSLSDLRRAYDILDEGFNAEPSLCADCAEDRELIFLHAMTRLAMWIGRDDGGNVDSFIELARLFDVEFIGNALDDMYMTYPLNKRDAYKLPRNYEQLLGSVLSSLSNNGANELNEILAELDMINDSPADPFYIMLYTYETNLLKDVELDYGEIMAIKAALYFMANVLGSQIPYDMYVDYETNQLIEKEYADMVKLNRDILAPHPYLGKILPTPNDPNDGTAALAQIKQHLINAVDMYIDAVDYIQAEIDDQSDDIIVIDEEFAENYEFIEQHLLNMQDTLVDDTSLYITHETNKYYTLYNEDQTTTWSMWLNLNVINEFRDGELELVSGIGDVDSFEILDYMVDNNEIYCELEGVMWNWTIFQGTFTGTLTSGQTEIIDGTLEYWGGYNTYPAITGITGTLDYLDEGIDHVDLNPVFGSERYPEPVSPRDILPEYDEYGQAVAGTTGHGLGDDPTMGGIFPDMTQEDWMEAEDAQPSGIITLMEAEPYQFEVTQGSTQFVDLWFKDQIVFTDQTNDTDTEIDSNIDIEKLYLGYDDDFIYGRLVLNDSDSTLGYYSYYEIYLSYSPDVTDCDDSIKISLTRDSSDSVSGTVYQMYDSGYGYSYWNSYYGIYSSYCRHTDESIDFIIPWFRLPAYVMGKYLTVNSYTWGSEGYKSDSNQTRLQIDGFATISGQITYDGFNGTPIYVQAYLDQDDPENSLLAQTFITEPGMYSFDNIPIGCTCYIRAFTPLFNVDNPFETGEFEVEQKQGIFVWTYVFDDVDIELNYPTMLQNGEWIDGELVANQTLYEWYAFDAIESGNYTIELQDNPSYSTLTLYSRDAYSKLVELQWNDTQTINWICPASGRYYVKTKMDYYDGTYQIRMSSDVECPVADIAAALGTEVMDCNVDMLDLAALTYWWQDEDCAEPLWCEKADIDNDGSVGLSDIAQMASQWLGGSGSDDNDDSGSNDDNSGDSGDLPPNSNSGSSTQIITFG